MLSVSTLMDGELDGADAAREITRFKEDASYRESWDAYHLIGDAMRGGALGSGSAPNFCARFSELLAQEPTVLAPRPRLTRKAQTTALQIAASIAAVAVVSWTAMNTFKPDVSIGELAKAPMVQPKLAELKPVPLPPRSAKPGTVLSEHVHEYLLAHQGISPTTAIQGVTPYIRTVSSTGD